MRTKLMPSNLGARDLPERICANVILAALVLLDPSRERSQVSILFTKPIPLGQLFDSKASDLDDTIKGG
ncbi:MAG TPA: hypothetical protein VK589_05390 [Chryseolinea sp.]|nr:hypothetical protein [Chryseolinea sp.]